MRKLLALCIFFTLGMSVSKATDNDEMAKTDANIEGRVVEKKTGEDLPGISIFIKGTTIGVTTDASGKFLIKNAPAGEQTIIMRGIGYKSIERKITIEKNKTITVNFEADNDVISIEQVVVSANRNETKRRLAPTLVSILDSKTFEYTNAATLSQGLGFEPGVRVENNCQNCGFSQVRINGLEGQYSQILIDSRPIFSALAGVYGLEQIPANMIDRVELVRGGGSALYGSSAIGGTINIITKEPISNGGSLGHTFAYLGGNTFGKDGEPNSKAQSVENITSFNGSVVSKDHKAGIMIFGQHRKRDAYFRDNDEFSEIPALSNRGMGFRSFYKPSIYSKLSLEYHTMQENRRGGSDLNLPEHEAEITEALRHSVNGGSLKYDHFVAEGKGHLSAFLSAQRVIRNSYYGGGSRLTELADTASVEDKNNYIDDINEALAAYGLSKDLTYQVGTQYAHNLDKFIFMPAEITAGIEYTGQRLTDETRLSEINDKVLPLDQKINSTAFFLQNEWKDEKWSFLLGVRADKHSSLKNIVLSPRVNLRYNPIEDVNIRLTYSEGFRAPQYFDEDLHTELAGSEPVKRILMDGLKEERSKSFSGSVDYYFYLSESVRANLLVEGFYTVLNNKFSIDHEEKIDDITLRYIGNAPVKATVAGANIEGRIAFGNTLQLQLGATLQNSKYKEAIEVKEHTNEHAEDDKAIMEKNFLKTPNFYSYFVLKYTPVKNFTASLSGTHTGSMKVLHEQYEDEDVINNGQLGTIVDGVLIRGAKVNNIKTTKSFFELGLKLAYDFNLTKTTKLQVNAGVQNITNAYQPDYDTGGGRASAYAYGPMLPRSIFVGTKITF